MTQVPRGGQGPGDPSSPRLPNFGAAGPPGGPTGSPGGGPGQRPPRRGWALAGIVAGVLITGLVLLLVVALVLWHTVLRPDPADPVGAWEPSSAEEPTDPEAGNDGEYIPGEDEDEEEQPAPESTHIEAPTEECVYFPQDPVAPASGDTRSSGDLSFTIPAGWTSEADWGELLPYAEDAASVEKHIELGYYAVGTAAQAVWPEDQEFPGLDAAARIYVQCHLTREDATQLYGPEPELTQYRDEAIEIDGHEGWIVSGVVELDDPDDIVTYTSVEIVAVVVETPSGPAVFRGAASADDPDTNAELQSMVDSLSIG